MDAESVQEYADIIMDALRNPHRPRPKGEPVIGEIVRTYVISSFKFRKSIFLRLTCVVSGSER